MTIEQVYWCLECFRQLPREGDICGECAEAQRDKSQDWFPFDGEDDGT